MKQSIVKEAKMTEYNGKKSYTATFEDGITGYYDAKNGELKQGDHVEYTVEERTNKKGGKFNLLTVTKTEAPIPVVDGVKPVQPHSTKTKYGIIDPTFILQERCKGVIESMKLTMQAVLEDKLTFDKVREQFKEVNTCVQEAIDEIISE